jgi:hypothetical protein
LVRVALNRAPDLSVLKARYSIISGLSDSTND